MTINAARGRGSATRPVRRPTQARGRPARAPWQIERGVFAGGKPFVVIVRGPVAVGRGRVVVHEFGVLGSLLGAPDAETLGACRRRLNRRASPVVPAEEAGEEQALTLSTRSATESSPRAVVPVINQFIMPKSA